MKLKAAEAHLKLGECGLETEQYEAAIEDFNSCLKIQVFSHLYFAMIEHGNKNSPSSLPAWYIFSGYWGISALFDVIFEPLVA